MKRPYLLFIPILVIIAAFIWRRAGQETFSPIPNPAPMENPEAPTQLTAAVSEVKGAASMSRGGLPLEGPRVGQALQAGDVITTNADGYVALEFYSGARAALDANTTVRVVDASIDPNDWKKSLVSLKVEHGRVWSRVLMLQHQDANYVIPGPSAVAMIRNGAFLTTVSEGKPALPTFHQINGTLVLTGKTDNRLHPGFSLAFTSPSQSNLTFTKDEIRNDAWMRNQLKADGEFAVRAEAVRNQRGVFEDVSKVGVDMGALDPQTEGEQIRLVIAPRNGRLTVRPGDTLDLKATLHITEDGRTTEKDVTGKVTWQVSDPQLVSVDPFGAVTANLTGSGKVIVGARYYSASGELSHSLTITIAGKPIVDIN